MHRQDDDKLELLNNFCDSPFQFVYVLIQQQTSFCSRLHHSSRSVNVIAAFASAPSRTSLPRHVFSSPWTSIFRYELRSVWSASQRLRKLGNYLILVTLRDRIERRFSTSYGLPKTQRRAYRLLINYLSYVFSVLK